MVEKNLARCRERWTNSHATSWWYGATTVVYENFAKEVFPPFCVLAYGDVEVDSVRGRTRRGSPNAGGSRRHPPKTNHQNPPPPPPPDKQNPPQQTLPATPTGAAGSPNQLTRTRFDVAYRMEADPIRRSRTPLPTNTHAGPDYPHADAREFLLRMIRSRQLIRPSSDSSGAVGWRGSPEDRTDETGSRRPSPAVFWCFALGPSRGSVFGRHRHSRRAGRLVKWSPAFLTDRPGTSPDREAIYGSPTCVRCRCACKVGRDTTAEIRRCRTAKAELVLLTGAVAALGPRHRAGQNVTTDVFHSNNLFAVFRDGGTRAHKRKEFAMTDTVAFGARTIGAGGIETGISSWLLVRTVSCAGGGDSGQVCREQPHAVQHPPWPRRASVAPRHAFGSGPPNRPATIVYSLLCLDRPHVGVLRRTRHREGGDRRQFPGVAASLCRWRPDRPSESPGGC